MNRILGIESATDVTISTFPLPRDILLTRRTLARNRHLLAYFANVEHDAFQNTYMDYQAFWHELHACILEDIRTRTQEFRELHGQTNDDNNNIRHGYLTGCDANTAAFLSAAYRILRSSYVLRTVSNQLRANEFYQTGHPSLVQIITQLLFDCIVTPRPNGFVFSFHQPDQIPDDHYFSTHIVLNEENENDTHTVPIVPFLYFGASRRIFDGNAFLIALPFPVRLQNDQTEWPGIDDFLHDHDIIFQTQFHTPPPSDRTGDYTRMNDAFEILTRGQGTDLSPDFVQRYHLFCR